MATMRTSTTTTLSTDTTQHLRRVLAGWYVEPTIGFSSSYDILTPRKITSERSQAPNSRKTS